MNRNYEFYFTLGNFSSGVRAVSVAQAVVKARGSYALRVLKQVSGTAGFAAGVNYTKDLPLKITLSPLDAQKYSELYRLSYANKGMLDTLEQSEFNQLSKIIEDLKKWK
jgi:hypothetical protein